MNERGRVENHRSLHPYTPHYLTAALILNHITWGLHSKKLTQKLMSFKLDVARSNISFSFPRLNVSGLVCLRGVHLRRSISYPSFVANQPRQPYSVLLAVPGFGNGLSPIYHQPLLASRWLITLITTILTGHSAKQLCGLFPPPFGATSYSNNTAHNNMAWSCPDPTLVLITVVD